MSNPAKTGRTQNENWSLAWQFARCELRHSVMRFRIFLAALMLGVAAIGAVGSVAESMRSGITDNGRMLLGGDFELSSLHVAPDDELLDKVRQNRLSVRNYTDARYVRQRDRHRACSYTQAC